ncbi:hypothetical protein H6G97_48645 [Nostoc flagelliforme FACHB-838]|uniref:DUF5648 domain-containing protein n=1 Tax=Nostoc flagelliforme FACHB-838 TaxID=2692904 RepID=A0ABR8E5M0_9NOSO|nr:hypothetical protein [Nostoc flagelliforme]MBD2536703.1 hypothetical protein [Nostoc flagelliforme FACHB-838]
MFSNWSVRRVLKTFGGLAVGIASISTVNYLTTNHLALATSNSSKLQNTNQLTISVGKSSSENILLAQVPSITRTINDTQVTAYPLYRYYNPSIVNHLYTTNFGELGNGNGGYISEGIAAYISTQQDPGTIPLYRAYSQSATNHFYTTNLSELVAVGGLGYAYEGVVGYIYSLPVTGTIPLYRYYSSKNTNHLYTTNFAELGNGRNGYVLEGITGYVIPS